MPGLFPGFLIQGFFCLSDSVSRISQALVFHQFHLY